MHKDQTIPGTHWPTGLLKMFVEHDGELNPHYLANLIAKSLPNISKACDSYQEGGTFIMQAARTKHTTIAISYVPKKTPEKNGVL